MLYNSPKSEWQENIYLVHQEYASFSFLNLKMNKM